MIRSLDWKDVGRGLTDIMFPPTCVFCFGVLDGDAAMVTAEQSSCSNRRHGDLCHNCMSHIRGVAIRNGCRQCGVSLPDLMGENTSAIGPLPDHLCLQCIKSGSEIDRLVVLGEYREVLREAVIACKRMSFSPLAANLGDLLALKVREVASPSDFGAVTYVPSHWYRRMKRGGIPTREIARRVAVRLGVPLANLLKNRRQTAKQGMLGDRERRENVSGAFGVKKGYALKAPRILIVDDVWTTGSTLREIAKQLRRGYDAEIWATVVARATGAHAK